MIRPCCRPSRVLLPMLIALLLTMLARPLAAQEVDRPCAEAVAPADDFQSTGIGLTSDELVALYGEGRSAKASSSTTSRDLTYTRMDAISSCRSRSIGRMTSRSMSSRWRSRSFPLMPNMLDRSRAARRFGLSNRRVCGAVRHSPNALLRWEKIGAERS